MLNRLEDIFSCLNENDVRYLVIGGIAAILHGVPRATFDLDILIDASEENAERLLAALQAAGLGTSALTTPAEILAHEITVFKDRVRIDVQTRTPGLIFDIAWRDRLVRLFKGHQLNIISLDHLIESKRASGRPKDLDDIRLLELTRKQTD